jgi:hypothetical protein
MITWDFTYHSVMILIWCFEVIYCPYLQGNWIWFKCKLQHVAPKHSNKDITKWV